MSNVRAIGERILAEVIERPQDYRQTKSGLYIADKDGTERAIRPRWFKIYSIGPDNTMGLSEGQYVYVEHGRWTREVKVTEELKIVMLDNKDILLVSDENPVEEQL